MATRIMFWNVQEFLNFYKTYFFDYYLLPLAKNIWETRKTSTCYVSNTLNKFTVIFQPAVTKKLHGRASSANGLAFSFIAKLLSIKLIDDFAWWQFFYIIVTKMWETRTETKEMKRIYQNQNSKNHQKSEQPLFKGILLVSQMQ